MCLMFEPAEIVNLTNTVQYRGAKRMRILDDAAREDMTQHRGRGEGRTRSYNTQARNAGKASANKHGSFAAYMQSFSSHKVKNAFNSTTMKCTRSGRPAGKRNGIIGGEDYLLSDEDDLY